MRGARRIGLGFAAAFFAFAASLSSADAQAVAKISFRELRVDADTGRTRGPMRDITVTLKGGADIEDRDQRTGVGRRAGPSRIAVNESALGGEFRREEGRGAIGQWRVGPNNTLIRTARYQTYVETLTLSLIGKTRCQARIVYQRQAGETLYVSRAGRFTDIRAEEPSCEISGQ